MRGATAFRGDETITAATAPVRVVDAVGAGDAFPGALLAELKPQRATPS